MEEIIIPERAVREIMDLKDDELRPCRMFGKNFFIIPNSLWSRELLKNAKIKGIIS